MVAIANGQEPAASSCLFELSQANVLRMSPQGQNRRFEKRHPNDRLLIGKKTLLEPTANGRFWPISAVPMRWRSLFGRSVVACGS